MPSLGFLERAVLASLTPSQGSGIITSHKTPSISDITWLLVKWAPVIASLGNNDYCCRGRVAEVFRRAEIPLLENEAGILTDGVDSVYIVGLGDNFLWQDDYFLATRGVPPGAPRIVLGHAPSIAEKLDPYVRGKFLELWAGKGGDVEER